MTDAIGAGVAYLAGRLEPNGLWRDFRLPGLTEGSTECVSAFIAAQIGAIPEGRSLAAGVVRTLLGQVRDSGGWGYRADVPEDCDSTAWTLLAAFESGTVPPPGTVPRACGFIARHQSDDGGFVTYLPEARPSLTPSDQDGWFEPDTAITASSGLALIRAGNPDRSTVARAARYLIDRQRPEGWASFWWNGAAFPTYVCRLALRELGHPVDHGEIPEPTGNPFAESLALRRPDADEHRLAGLARLLLGGGAPAGAQMLAPGALHGTDLLLHDDGAVTVACLIRTLHEARTRSNLTTTS